MRYVICWKLLLLFSVYTEIIHSKYALVSLSTVYYYYYYYYYYFFPGQPRYSVTRNVNHSGFYWSKR